MSRVTRRKHIIKEMMDDDFELPKENQEIVRVINSRGNNLHEVESSNDLDNQHFLVSMPTKFRKNIWVKRGCFLLVEPIEEGDKVKAEIVKILTPEHIKEYTKHNIWPKHFTKKREIEIDEDDDDDNFDLTRNLNRPHINHNETESDSSDEE